MDVIIWAIILGAVFYINKKSKSAGSKNTQPNKPRPQQKQMQQRAQQPQRPQMQQRVQPQHTKAADGAKIIEAETQSMFGSVEDLIAMGYSGNLEFERDFLGEGLDMINNF